VSSPELQPANIANLQGAKVAVPGANPITTNNKVVTATGQATDNTARPMSDTAPKQTSFLDKSTLPSGLTKITIANGTFSPSTFTTTVGAPTTFSLTGGDSLSHVIAFDDTSLNAIAILVGPGQTKAITFNAPSKAGSYTFRDASPSDKPAVGTMIVK
jgi:plastocyanin